MTKVAVVVGASIGGLLAGLVLAVLGCATPHVETVVLETHYASRTYIARAHGDVFVATALLEVMQYLAPPGRLFAPEILLRLTQR